MENHHVNFFVISDSVGETARKVLNAVLSQFPDVETVIHQFPFVRKETELKNILIQAKEKEAVIIHTLVTNNLSSFTEAYCKENEIRCYDVLKDLVSGVSEITNQSPIKRAGASHQLDDEYFNRISAIEFAVKYDDGKDPKGLLEADLVLLGISRTSKTPLSMFLANKNIRVANLPIMPEAQIPDELWEVNPKKIVGLTNDIETLVNFRKERMIAYGLSEETIYSNIDRVKKEIAFADELYEKLDCYIINVAKRSIEETTEIIIKNVLNKYRVRKN